MDKIEVTFNDQQIGAEFPTGLVREYDYNKVKNKPKINGVELVGDVSTELLGLTSDQIKVEDKDNYFEGETIEEVFSEIGEKMKDGLGKIDDVINADGTSLVNEKVAKITPQNIGAIPQIEKGEVNGVATLDERAKIIISQLPDFILGQVLFGGTVINSNGVLVATLTNNAKQRLGTLKNEITPSNDNVAITGYVANEGIYYIAKNDFTFAGIEFEIGDWLISDGTAWQKIDNTDSAGVENIEVKGTIIVFTFTDGSKQEFELPYENAELADTTEIDGLDNLQDAVLNLASTTPEIGVINEAGIHTYVPEIELELADGRLITLAGHNTLPIRAGVGVTFTKNSNNTISINALNSGGGGASGEGGGGLIALSPDEMYALVSNVANLGKVVAYLGETTDDYKQNELYVLVDDSTGTGFLRAKRAGKDTIKSITQKYQTNTEVGYDDHLNSRYYFKLENIEIEYGDGEKGTFDAYLELPITGGKDISVQPDEKGKTLKIDIEEEAKQIKIAGIPELIEAYAQYHSDCGKLITYPYAKAGTPFMYTGETIKEFYFNDIPSIDFSQFNYDENGVAYILKAGDDMDSVTAKFSVACVDISKQTNGQIDGNYFAIVTDKIIAQYANFSNDFLGIKRGWTFGEGVEPNKLIDLGKELVIFYMGGGVNIYPLVLLAQTISKTPFVESSQKGVYMITEQADGSVKAEKVGGGLPKFPSADKGKFLVVGDDGNVVAETMTIGESMLI